MPRTDEDKSLQIKVAAGVIGLVIVAFGLAHSTQRHLITVGGHEGDAADSAGTSGVYLVNEGRSKTIPTSVELRYWGDRFRFRSLTPWQGWGEPQAFATGRYRYNVCSPTCTSKNYKWTAVRVTLSRPQPCGPRTSYRRLRYDPRKTGLARVTVQIDCSGRAIPAFYDPDPPQHRATRISRL